MNMTLRARRPGFTLVEVLVALVLTAVVGAAVTSVFVSQNAFYDTQEKVTSARAVSRAATNMLMTELRAVETTDGIIAAGPDSLRVKVPFALGVSCGLAAAGQLHVSLLPVDSAVYADARLRIGGFAWRDPVTGEYDSRDLSSVAPALVTARCLPAGITTSFDEMNSRARVVTLSVPSWSVPDAVPIMLYQYVTYRFAPSALVPGERGLWRQVHHSSSGRLEELAAPFDETARFRFYVAGSSTPQDAPPTPITNLRGVELVFTAESERPEADGSERVTPMTTAVFFRNRID